MNDETPTHKIGAVRASGPWAVDLEKPKGEASKLAVPLVAILMVLGMAGVVGLCLGVVLFIVRFMWSLAS